MFFIKRKSREELVCESKLLSNLYIVIFSRVFKCRSRLTANNMSAVENLNLLFLNNSASFLLCVDNFSLSMG